MSLVYDIKTELKSNDDVELKQEIEKLSADIAKKFKLFDWHGRPRKAFILNTLMNNSCVYCISKILSNKRKNGGVDSIYSENHKLAVGLLMEKLQYQLKVEGFNLQSNDEVNNEYGRADIFLEPTFTGLQVNLNGSKIIIEVKTGKGISYSQLFRYLIGEPETSMIIVWRVLMGQTFALIREDVKDIIISYMNMILSRGEKLLEEKIQQCTHRTPYYSIYIIKNPQKVINDFTDALSENLPKAVDNILHIIKTNGYAEKEGK